MDMQDEMGRAIIAAVMVLVPWALFVFAVSAWRAKKRYCESLERFINRQGEKIAEIAVQQDMIKRMIERMGAAKAARTNANGLPAEPEGRCGRDDQVEV